MPLDEQLSTKISAARNEGERWRLKSEEIQRTAEAFDETGSRDGLMRIVESYRAMARRAEKRVEVLEQEERTKQSTLGADAEARIITPFSVGIRGRLHSED